MTLLDIIPNTKNDCRKYRKDYGSDKDNARGWQALARNPQLSCPVLCNSKPI
jgi:hypothetical protein